MKVCVVGAGAWGTTVANVLAQNGDDVTLWCHEPEVAESISATRCNGQFLPNVTLCKQITPTSSFSQALSGSEWIFMAVPVQHFRSVLKEPFNDFTTGLSCLPIFTSSSLVMIFK